MKILFTSAAKVELAEAAAYYDDQLHGLGRAFLDEVDASLKRISAFPEAWQKLSTNTRRCRLHRFPYGLIYRHRDDSVLVIAVGHLHREPTHWQQSDEQ